VFLKAIAISFALAFAGPIFAIGAYVAFFSEQIESPFERARPFLATMDGPSASPFLRRDDDYLDSTRAKVAAETLLSAKRLGNRRRLKQISH
jgi:hypothetical protein